MSGDGTDAVANRERMRAEADRLGFDVSDDLLEQCLQTARQLDETDATVAVTDGVRRENEF